MKQAMIFAAGLGTRLKPLSLNTPKALIPIGGKPILTHILDKLQDFDRVVINVHYLKEKIIQYLETRKDNFQIIVSEEEELLDTGGGLKNALTYLNPQTTTLVYNADIFSTLNLEEFYRFHQEEKNTVSLATRNRTSKRLLHFDAENQLIGRWNGEEINTEEQLFAYSGIALLETSWLETWGKYPAVFSLMQPILEEANKIKIKAYPHNQDQWWDLGRIEVYEKLLEQFPN